MTDATADESVEENINAENGEEKGDDKPAGKLGGKKRLIIIAAAAVLLLAGGGAGVYFSGLLDSFFGGETKHAADTVDNVVYFDLPEMVVNLESGSKKKSYLKIQVALELDASQDTNALTRVLPRVIDQFHVFLRELRADDLQGSAGIYRVKEELLRRVTVAAHPIAIRNVLFKEMLIQ